jgi:hypothetical protein
MDAAGHQLVADVLGRVEADRQLASLERWADSPEVRAAMVRDPARESVERDRARAAKANTYSDQLASFKARQSTLTGCSGCQWCARGVPSSCVYR